MRSSLFRYLLFFNESTPKIALEFTPKLSSLQPGSAFSQEGYTCECKAGFADISPDRVNKPGRICKKTSNECGQRETYGVDCDPNAACVDTPEGFQCCVEVVNECTTGKADCSCNADCFDRDEGYECKCRPGFVDASPDTAKYPGRVCNRPKSPEHYGQVSVQPQCRGNEQCGPNEECRFNAQGKMVCQCKLFSQCERVNECDRNAICSNTYDGFKCQCKAGFIDLSPDPYHLPGRKCQQIVNECADGTADCSPFADCVDLQQGYMCKCKMGYTDVSSRYQLQPGRKCSQASNQCSDRKLNSCDENADCVQLPDGYTCKCFAGYVDVSSNANLQPGRVCTLSTVCPVQATDLVFLIDGSGSIGSYIFQTEVLRFLAEFTELFDIAPDKTRVSVVQYSDQIRHEFELGDYMDSASLKEGIKNIDYLTGLTRTGAAIEHVANEAFSERRGARPLSQRVTRVGIVITDGRSQDNVSVAAENARRQNIQLFAVGVTNHVLQAELEEITGAKDRTFHVNAFEDLNTRLRSAIQRDHATRLRMPAAIELSTSCECPEGFDQHPITKACGGDVCNPEIATSCPDPEICEKTPFGNWRCTCPEDLGWRDRKTGACSEPGFTRNAKADKCLPDGTCDPTIPNSCDARKKEKCLQENTLASATLLLSTNVTTSRKFACSAGSHDCDPNAKCTDTDESFICTCNSGFIDKSPDPSRKPGRKCTQLRNECEENRHNCSANAECIDLVDGFLCRYEKISLEEQTLKSVYFRCKEGFVDVSPNMHVFAGLECRALVDECASKDKNTCHEHALCIGTNACLRRILFPTLSGTKWSGIDTRDAYKCQCKEGYVDHDELRNPGRDCRKGRKCLERVCLDDSKHDCHVAAVCEEVDGPEKYTCKCRDGYVDANREKPGRQCRELINECLDSSLNDCDPAATCRDTPDSYECECPIGSRDVSKDPAKPGRNCFGVCVY
ncbi:unnamed protein product [Nippostrongylus brasiliensis]|uniref:Transmembrane matrix receptor MUP-4 (inferred by orthology to a C. elegans protein) n=1 Tax=Nippostrongylus brasiliensis TaxID=27835 RepID=A0A0N4YLC6_NIPBR|nr:unnamed protein product [Nippostrongylus brasiliensis]